MATITQTPILRLSKEMLLRIASFASEPDILSLRLACRELHDASSDAFARSFAHIECCFLDPVSLLRALRITATAHLGPSVRRLVIMASPSHTRREAHTAARDGESHEMSIRQWQGPYHTSQTATNQVAPATPSSIHWALAKGILENIKHRSNCQLWLRAHTGPTFRPPRKALL
ncbi:hypothetical protein M409DRAFT_58006 [Zasmidium cellare ATCC 36951]|uniref:F-box domain-containing protein n=1 Tax=Zasmidium cellare ATCC 36951 TaxID=1080233 RepID=A0A6A6C9Q7_ZASCE|nr:uncharacterized protein M409DRAFT_58006 [Zasmidium cellare ATCC 36951]KAF2162970.1 hypothetical protein M409DRAFT_58006 [Zasmidium cellare ATCC 36951]